MRQFIVDIFEGWGQALQKWGIIVLLLIILAVQAVILVALPELGADVTPTTSDTTIKTVPAMGVEGFRTEEFCNHPDTIVTSVIVPDAVGATYQLTRTIDGVMESVVYNTNAPETAKHYFDIVDIADLDGDGDTADIVQDSEPAFITGGAIECMEDKARE